MAQKESDYNKASANERLFEKRLQNSTETVEKLRKQLHAEQGILGRLLPALSQAKETTKQSLDGLRAMRIAVHGAGADGDKNAPRPAPMEQDTDMFKQKIRLLNESAKRARTDSNMDHSALPECVDVLSCEANALSSTTKTRRTSSISTRVFDDESRLESGSNLVAKEIGVVVANIDQFGPTTNRFLESPAANGIAGFLFSEMHVKEQGLVKLRCKFALQGFHSSVSAATPSLSCRNLARVGVLFRSQLAISHPFRLHPTWICRFRLVVDDPLVVRHTCVVFNLTCNTGIARANFQKLSEIGSYVTNAGIPFVIAGECVAFRVVGIKLACPSQRRKFAPV